MAIAVTQPTVKGKKLPTGLLLFGVIAVAFGAVAFLIFLRPEVAPTADILDKFLPQGSVIREIEAIDLNIDSVTSDPVFRTLKEIGPVPLTVPQTGKQNPFL